MIGWSLATATLMVIVVGLLVLALRLQSRQNAIRALDAIEETGVPLGPMHLGDYRTGTENIGVSVEVELRGPDWLRNVLGDQHSREWLDEPVGVNLCGTVADDDDLRQAAQEALKKQP